MMEITGDAGREPLKHGLNQAAHLAGVNAAAAVLAASLGVRRTGQGGAALISLSRRWLPRRSCRPSICTRT